MKNTGLTVSIIVPVYKAERFIEQCVNSILNQSYRNLDIILVDDGSPDQCPAICDGFAERDSRIRVIHKENRGLSSAREIGIQTAVGDYVMVIDSDDWIDSVTIAACVNRAIEDDADCVLFGYKREYNEKSLDTPLFMNDFSYGNTLSEEKVHRRIVGPVGEELANPQRVDSLSSVCMKLYRTETAKRGRIVNERMVGSSEDTVFNLYALDGCKISYINQCFYHYRKTNDQSLTSRYRADLPDKWDILYRIFQEYIDQSGRETYRIPFFNRVACGMIGLGLNENRSGHNILLKAKNLRIILSKPLYLEALSQLDTSYCSMKWKLFFFLCKKRLTLLLALLLRIMAYLRARIAA